MIKQAADDNEADGGELTFTRGLKLWSSWEANGDEKYWIVKGLRRRHLMCRDEDEAAVAADGGDRGAP